MRHKSFIRLLLIITLAGILLYKIYNNTPVIHLGINAEIVEINVTERVLSAIYVDTTKSTKFKFYIDCNDAIKHHQIIYCNYDTHNINEIFFDTLSIGDEIILSLSNNEFEKLKRNAIVQAHQIQLATQRLN